MKKRRLALAGAAFQRFDRIRSYGRFVLEFGRFAFEFVVRLAFEFMFVFDVFVFTAGVLVGIGVDVGAVLARFELLAAVLVFAGEPQAKVSAPKARNDVVTSILFITYYSCLHQSFRFNAGTRRIRDTRNPRQTISWDISHYDVR